MIMTARLMIVTHRLEDSYSSASEFWPIFLVFSKAMPSEGGKIDGPSFPCNYWEPSVGRMCILSSSNKKLASSTNP